MTIIKSLLDNDMYKFSMAQAVYHQFPQSKGRYKFVMRSKNINMSECADRIWEEIKNYSNLSFSDQEITYLSTLPFIKPSFLEYLSNLKQNTNGIKFSCNDGNINLEIEDYWVKKILFEVPVMAIISECYLSDKTNREGLADKGFSNLKEKVKLIKNSKVKVNFSDFGTRRRYSHSWHDTVVEFLKNEIPESFTGTSNLYFANKYNLNPIGTMAHEWLMAGQSLTRVEQGQKFMLEKWIEEYKGQLGIALTDTIGMEPFLKDFDTLLAKVYDGCRHDSADPFIWGDRLISHYEKLKIDPSTKKAVFSDGLNFEKMIQLAEYFNGRIQTSFGIGTNLTNDVGVTPLSMVIKLVELNGYCLAKISDEPIKAICDDSLNLSYLKKVYGLNYLN